jgi:hypothetical protein
MRLFLPAKGVAKQEILFISTTCRVEDGLEKEGMRCMPLDFPQRPGLFWE